MIQFRHFNLRGTRNEEARESGITDPLGTLYAEIRRRVPPTFAGDEEKAEDWALMQLRISLASRRFNRGFAEHFPEKAAQLGYQTSEDYRQGNVLAFRIAGEYLVKKSGLSLIPGTVPDSLD